MPSSGPDEDRNPESESSDAHASGSERPREPETLWEARARAQAGLVMGNLREIVEPRRENGRIKYYVRKDYLLVREESAAAVRELLASRLPDKGERPPPGSPKDGAVKYGHQWIQLKRDSGTFAALEVIRRDDRFVGETAPEHLVYLTHDSPTSTNTSCPAEEPSPVLPGMPPDPLRPADCCAGEDIKVVIIDTGLDHRATKLPWMNGVTGQPDRGINNKREIGPYAGHGTFIAGVVRSMAPRAEVHVRDAFPRVGTAFEDDLVTALEQTLIDDRPDIISLSAGTYAGTLGGPELLNGFCDHLRKYKGVVLVAAAGNDHSRQFFWPAALPCTVSVGALAANWRRRAHFSNFGGWVDVYAPGEHLINAFPSGTYCYQEPPQQGSQMRFSGMARWSGTSFATPLVSGLIAARMSCTGENGRAAAAALLARARAAAVPGVGPVLVPDMPGLTCHEEAGKDQQSHCDHCRHRC